MRITTALLAFALVGFCLEAAEAKPPNVLLIISDDQTWSDYGFMGHDVIQTPHLDTLAKESLTFTRGYVPSSLCRPSLMTIATGLFPHQHGVTGNDPPRGTDRSKMLKHVRSVATLPKLLAKRGYLSLQTGKWWEGNYKEGGFTHGMTQGRRHGDKGLRIGREGLKPIKDFIAEAGDRPFFIWYAPFLPHTPHNPPERLLKKYRAEDRSIHVAKYYAMCDWFDETCGELLGHLDKQGLRKDTLVIYVTDNGWIQRKDRGGYAPKSKRSPYDGGLRTPIMVRWPGEVEPQMNEKTLVSSIDLAPTILKACGLKATEQMQGVDLLSGEDGPLASRQRIFGEIFAHDVADIDDPTASLQYRWVIDGWEKLILPAKQGRPELYDLKVDLWEEQNLAAKRPETVAELKKRINAWWPAK